MRVHILGAVLAVFLLAAEASAASVNDLCGIWRLSAPAVDAVTAALTTAPADMSSDQAATIAEGLRTRLGQMRWTITATTTTMVWPDAAPVVTTVDIVAVDHTTFAVTSVDAKTGQSRTSRLQWVDATHLQASDLTQTMTGPVQPATKIPDGLALERVTP